MKRLLAAFFFTLASLSLVAGPGQQMLIAVGPAATPPPAGTAFITGQSLGTPRSNFTAELGCVIVVGGSNITVTQLGRWVISGNSASHLLKIRKASDASVVGSVSVNTSGATTGAFLYGTLGSPITLNASETYYLLSEETNMGDEWYDNDTTVTSTAVASVDSAGYYDGTLHAPGSAGQTYVLVSFKYSSP